MLARLFRAINDRKAVYHEGASLREFVERWLAERGTALRQPDWVKSNPVGMESWLREAVLRAWPCARQGLSEFASEIFGLTQQLHAEYHAGYSLQQHLSDEIAHVTMCRAVRPD
jgi:hypothetical protein